MVFHPLIRESVKVFPAVTIISGFRKGVFAMLAVDPTAAHHQFLHTERPHGVRPLLCPYLQKMRSLFKSVLVLLRVITR